MNTPLKYFCKPYFKLRHRRLVNANALSVVRDSAPSALYTLPGLCAAYQWPTGLPGGGVIAIVELGGGWINQDMVSFFQSIGQPVPQIIDVSVDGTTNSPNQSADADQDAD